MASGFNVKVTSKGNKGPQVADALKGLTRKRVLVGVPEKTTLRKSGPVNNAQLAYIHTNGSQVRGIPARPIIEPALEAPGNKEPITDELKQAASAALDGKPTEVTLHLKRAGMTAQNAVKGWFTDPRNNWAPNAASTIKRKGSDKPLINTASLRGAMTYVVEEK